MMRSGVWLGVKWKMSRIGRSPIDIPSDVKVDIKDNFVSVRGPKGNLSRKIHDDMILKVQDKKILVDRPSDNKEHRSLHGLSRSLIANMVIGVTDGFEKALEINGVGYRADLSGNKLTLQLGYSHPVVFDVPKDVEVEVGGQTQVKIKGRDKQLVGDFAARVRNAKKMDPYRGKGIKYIGEYVKRKAGKTGIKTL